MMLDENMTCSTLVSVNLKVVCAEGNVKINRSLVDYRSKPESHLSVRIRNKAASLHWTAGCRFFGLAG